MSDFVGEKFGVLGKDKYNTSVIVKRIREDLKKEFPAKIYKFSVTKSGSRTVSAITINIKQAPRFELIDETIDPEAQLRYTDQFKDEFIKKIYHIAQAYNYDHSDIMSDYFDVNYYLDVKCRWWHPARGGEGTKII